MELFAPSYYQEFVCIADRCRHSCCIGWEIDVDEDTLDVYRHLPSEVGKPILQSIDSEECPHFKLLQGDRCPHLDERGLCRIILTLGEDYLCDICREHPRFYHVTSRGMEVGLGIACEEACRLVLSHANYWDFYKVGEIEREAEPMSFDACAHRKKIYEILSAPTPSYAERLKRLYVLYEIFPKERTDADWRAVLASLEYLEEEHRALFQCYSSEVGTFCAHDGLLERALAYFIFRHCSSACDMDGFRASLGLAFVLERLLSSMITEQTHCSAEDVASFARILSEELEYSEENTEAIRDEFLR